MNTHPEETGFRYSDLLDTERALDKQGKITPELHLHYMTQSLEKALYALDFELSAEKQKAA